MKVWLINKFLYPKGGDAICTLATGELLRSRGHEVVFWGMKHPDNPSYLHEELFVDNLDLNSAGGLKKQLDIAAKLLYSLEAKNKLEALIKKIGCPDIVHLHNFAHQISPSILDVLKKYNIPAVMTMHDYKMVCASYKLLSRDKPCERCSMGRYYYCLSEGCVKGSRPKSLLNTIEMYYHHKFLKIYDHIHTLVSPSMFLKDKLQEMGFNNRTIHIPNFINIKNYAPVYGVQERRAVFCGRLSSEKGLITLIDAVKDLDLQLDIVGDGPMKEALVRKVSVEMIDNVHLMGYRTGRELKELVGRAAFVVIPSEWYENNPLSVLEAFALGKPVVGARIGGIPELVQEGRTGLTFKHGDAEDARKAVCRMIAHGMDLDAMGRQARDFLEKNFNSDIYFDRVMSVYEEAVRAV